MKIFFKKKLVAELEGAAARIAIKRTKVLGKAFLDKKSNSLYLRNEKQVEAVNDLAAGRKA